jgi:hypothetical protein
MDILSGLQSKNSDEAYRLLLLLEEESERSDELYSSLNLFLPLLKDKSSLVRTRGFRLICAQARWDRVGWLERHLDELLAELDDGKATAVRQCLAALHPVVLFQPELRPRIREKLDRLDLSKYKDSMIPLLLKDMNELRGTMEEQK